MNNISLLTEELKVVKEALREAKDELDVQMWGLKKTNEAIKILYKELADKNKRLQELDQLKSDFLSMVSHELRTPLAIMKEFVLLLWDEIPGKLNTEQKEYILTIISNIDRLARLINDLLDVSKMEAGKVELKRMAVNIIDLAEGVVSNLKVEADKKNIAINKVFGTPALEISADLDKVIQIFTNLINNAIKFTPEGGQITVKISDKGQEVECSVSDTGVGIPREDFDKVFTKFQQFNRTAGAGSKGTGLGLAITKELVELHKGKIWVDSEAGKGTAFIFTLPKVVLGTAKNKGAGDEAKDKMK